MDNKKQAEQIARQDLLKAKDYFNRQDVNFFDVFDFLKEVKDPALWKIYKGTLHLKAQSILRTAKNVEEKVEMAIMSDNQLFYNIVIQENDVTEYLSSSFTVDKATLERERDVLRAESMCF